MNYLYQYRGQLHAPLLEQLRRNRTKNEANNSSSMIAPTGSVGPIRYRTLSDVEMKPIRWLWPDRIARGKVTMIAGHPGLGKSQLTLYMAATVSTGSCWPVTDERCECGSVLLLNAEDDAADTLRPRLEAAGADLKRCFIIDAVCKSKSRGAGTERQFNLQADLKHLEAFLIKHSDVALIVIDPITAYLGDADSHNNGDIRGLLASLAEFAARHDIAVVCVSHLNKSAGNNDALMRVTGSVAFVAVSRAAFIVASDPDNKERRLFLPIKNNIGKDRDGLAFSVTRHILENGIETSRISWEEEIETRTADDIMAAGGKIKQTGAETAKSWLQDVLHAGPLPASEVERQARAEGFSNKMLRQAREKLKIKPQKQGFGDGWSWALPGNEDAQDAQDALPEE